ncbi:undecaprenyl/decaprenyl-phosphate alpha-N-acetylglucosaminyl 1-phosphate transferase [Aliarcobacter butzleri]|uniref:glycosyltransferase family 4 protein n=1 Tax=Aliarcobacter butzleri TaxID=28197 RepID=UPI001EDDB1C4|nr:MraY family glycosyltransferase [Aliarcobacter butzleri]MCG3697526.1 undecaprenyl/decaprenyl-phosphate alpha-N-acetylglucosaminyl 1-phosphate transferase [Aliarcobacter butzleri]MCG3698954.1 undecaprenyl/decaprenyl-phosphate alpha-N-acetylglucosaminyl 1-phosphate transferase [Aliarcobacter butzleri]MCT7619679.1 undecaprenyl/decaprenyl-phosphate alpha-N-acetylglucosaminyl 1-phosphate transferase [Aliarcobacter butzleri]
MDYTLYILTIVFFISLILNKLLINYSHKLKLIDKPNERSLHQVEKSRAGGIAIFLSFIIGLVLFNINLSFYLTFAFFIIFFLGIYDDIKNLSSKIKFFWIIVAATFLYIDGYFINSIGVFSKVDLIMPPSMAYLFLLFAVVGFINAMNLIDGLDGLSSGIGIVILISFAYIGFKYNDNFLFYISMTLIFSLCGFLIFNWYPSTIFMGDTGSLSLGFVIVVLSIYSINSNYISAVSVLLLAAVPILDTLIVMFRRISQKKNPFKADKTHIHHVILFQQNKNIRKTSLILILLQLIFVYIGLGFKVRDDIYILGVFIMLFILFYLLLTTKNLK